VAYLEPDRLLSARHAESRGHNPKFANSAPRQLQLLSRGEATGRSSHFLQLQCRKVTVGCPPFTSIARFAWLPLPVLRRYPLFLEYPASSVIPNQPFQAYLELLWVTHQINCPEAHPVALDHHVFID